MDKITIVTVTYNCVSCLEKTIQSCISQDYKNKEYIIIDGGSSDGTVDLIKKYSSSINFWLSESDKGIFDAMNKGIKHSTGDWIVFMNAGDFFYNEQTISRIFQEDVSGYGVIHGKHAAIVDGEIQLREQKPFYAVKKKMRGMGFSHQACFVKSELARKHLFSPTFRLSADYNQIYTLYYKEHAKFKQVDFTVAVMNGNDGATRHQYMRHLDEVCRICEEANYCEKLAFKCYHTIRMFYHNIRFKIKK